jgi:hypothetical protein
MVPTQTLRKQIIDHSPVEVDAEIGGALDLQRLARIELTSEDPHYPIEAALTPTAGAGWRAAHGGEQIIRLLFDEPQAVRRIQISFREDQYPRTQEFVLRWSENNGLSYSEIVRQQYVFSPPGTTQEAETYVVDLVRVTALELSITPDKSGGDARASLRQLRIA